MTGTYGTRQKTFTLCAARTIIFQRKNLNSLIVCFTESTMFFSILLFSIANLFDVLYLWDVRNEDKCCVVTHRLVDICVAWLVYLASLSSHVLRAYCNFDQNKPSRLLYLGDAQITIVPRESTAEEVSFKW